jgi:hypothetical protein
MKLVELGLKSKPMIKYFDGGYIKFSTANKDLSFAIWVWKDRTLLMKLSEGKVKDKDHLNYLMKIKTKDEVITA